MTEATSPKSPYGPITIAIRARFEYDSSTIRLQHATTRYEVFCALAYEIVYDSGFQTGVRGPKGVRDGFPWGPRKDSEK